MAAMIRMVISIQSMFTLHPTNCIAARCLSSYVQSRRYDARGDLHVQLLSVPLPFSKAQLIKTLH
jgi:hypothetical protein